MGKIDDIRQKHEDQKSVTDPRYLNVPMGSFLSIAEVSDLFIALDHANDISLAIEQLKEKLSRY